MLRSFVVLLAIIFPTFAQAENVHCKGAYVGRISIHNKIGLYKVVFLSNPANTNGSFWVSFEGWDKDAKKEVLSLLMTAKAAQHRVDVYTTAEDSCSIDTPGQILAEVHLSTNK